MIKTLSTFILSIAFAASIHAQNVTWGATGLPPGLSISSANGTTGLISGVPTTPGYYTAIVYPKIGTLVGDMQKIQISVLPSGSDLPVYYGYYRLLADGTDPNPIAGGSGYILASAYPNKLFFTTDGINFLPAALPQGVDYFGWPQQAAIAGTRCIFPNTTSTSQGSNLSIYYSDNRTAFKALSIPTTINSYGNPIVFSNGTNRFFLFSSNQSFGQLDIWTMQNNQLIWTQRASINCELDSYNIQKPSIAVNGSFLVLALSDSNKSQLFYSTNGGDTWQVNATNPGICSVAYGNNVFIGTGQNGLWKSSNGVDWQKVSSQDQGQLIYSSKEQLFFSNVGVSKNGLDWSAYNDSSGSPITSNSGVVMLYNKQLIPSSIPKYGSGGNNFSTRKATVGKTFSMNIRVFP